MRSFPAILAFLLISPGCFLSAQDSEEFNPLGRDVPTEQFSLQLRIQAEWIEMKHETYTDLLSNEDEMKVKGRLSGDAGPMRKELAKLIEKEDARILETAMVIARSGQRAKVESIAEYIYPTEYDPPGVVGDVESGAVKFRNTPTPAAFETRNVGVTMEVDPVLGADEKTIDLNLAPEIVYLVDEAEYGEFESDSGEVDIIMPVFYTMKLTTQLTMIDGQYTLLGVNSPVNEDTLRTDPDRKVLVFVKADIVHVGLDLPAEKE